MIRPRRSLGCRKLLGPRSSSLKGQLRSFYNAHRTAPRQSCVHQSLFLCCLPNHAWDRANAHRYRLPPYCPSVWALTRADSGPTGTLPVRDRHDPEVMIMTGGALAHRDIQAPHFSTQMNFWFPLHDLESEGGLLLFPHMAHQRAGSYLPVSDSSPEQ